MAEHSAARAHGHLPAHDDAGDEHARHGQHHDPRWYIVGIGRYMTVCSLIRTSCTALSGARGIVGAVRQDGRVPQDVEPPSSVLIVVGREEFTPPSSFGGGACAATDDCIVVAVRDVEDGPTTLSMSVTAPAALTRLGEFRLLSEGLVGVRDLSFREHEAVGRRPGLGDGHDLGRCRAGAVRGRRPGGRRLATPLQLDRLGERPPYALGVGAVQLDHHLLVRLHRRGHRERPGMVVQEPLAGVEVRPHQHAVAVELPRDQAVVDVPPGSLGGALLPYVVVGRPAGPARPRSACHQPDARPAHLA